MLCANSISKIKLDGIFMQNCGTLGNRLNQNGQPDEILCIKWYCMLLREMSPRFELVLGTFSRQYEYVIEYQLESSHIYFGRVALSALGWFQ